MPAYTAALAEHFRLFHGVVDDARLDQLGVSRHQRVALIGHGIIAPIHRGVYHARSAPVTLESRSLGICLADPRAVITGAAAGRLWAVRRMPPADRIDVRVPHGANSISAPGVRLRRCNALDPVDVVLRPDGIRVVSPPRLAFDIASEVSDLDLESIIEQILDRGWCTIQTLYDTGRRLCHPARPGSSRFGRVVGSRPAWLKPVDSHLEMRLYDALRASGVDGLVRQHPIPLPGGWTIHADIAVPRALWAVEIDHVTWHGGRIDAQRDKQNDRQARTIGWGVDRVTDEDVVVRLPEVTAELVAIHDARLRSMRSRPSVAG
jgi:hypothetical protein